MDNLSLIKAVTSRNGLGAYFKDISTWSSWMVFLKALTGIQALTAKEKVLFRDCTGLSHVPKVIKEVYAVAGRRSGKSTICALLAVFYAVWGDWQRYTSRGESPMIFVIACNKDQASIILKYVKAIFELTPFLRGMVKRKLAESVELRNGVEIRVKPASWRSSRGYTVGLLIMEELSYWRFEEESVLRDREIYASIKPGMITIPNSLIIGISTPHAKQGLLYEKYRRHYGKPGNILVWQAATWVMNKKLTKKQVEEEHLEALGPEEFHAQYEAGFREDIENYLPVDIIDRAIMEGVVEVPEREGVEYFGFCDPSEGLHKRGDSMTFAISHKEDDCVLLDVVMEFRPPFDPGVVIETIAEKARTYYLHSITQDRHAVGWIAKDLREFGIDVEVAGKTKSQIYEHFSVLMNKNRVKLLDIERLKSQCAGLQRYVKSGGKVTIDHDRGRKDDIINSVAGSCLGSALEAGDDAGPSWAGTGPQLEAQIRKETNSPEGIPGKAGPHPVFGTKEDGEARIRRGRIAKPKPVLSEQERILEARRQRDADMKEEWESDWATGGNWGGRRQAKDTRLAKGGKRNTMIYVPDDDDKGN